MAFVLPQNLQAPSDTLTPRLGGERAGERGNHARSILRSRRLSSKLSALRTFPTSSPETPPLLSPPTTATNPAIAPPNNSTAPVPAALETQTISSRFHPSPPS